ncbi:MAG: putative replicase [Cressdnaviricota sp.]|nr:MAG: putative replicase [Cressdnaviricota sp.]
MPLYQLRITIDHDPDTFKPLPQASRSFSSVELLLTRFVRGGYKDIKPTIYTYGRETLDKAGDLCKPHIHFHFEIEPQSFRSLKEWFQKTALTEYEITLKFNTVWCFQERSPDEQKDAFAIWQYPLKTQHDDSMTNPNLNNIDLLSPTLTLDLLRRDAFTIYQRTAQKNKLYKTQSAEKKSLYHKLEQYVLDNQPSVVSHETIWLTELQYYITQSKSICPKTLNGYTILYLLNQNYLTPKQYYALNNQNLNIPLIHNAPIQKETPSTQTPEEKSPETLRT